MFRSFPYMLVCGVLVQAICHTVLSDDSRPKATILQQADLAARNGNSAEAERLATEAIAGPGVDAYAYYLRGRERFRLGKVEASVADFDQYAKRRPDRSTRLWERGISCYYSGQYQAGAAQFSAYQNYHGNDVENAVWHVLCLARLKDLEAAQREIMPIKSDRRIPMMKIYALFRGEAKPEDVLETARASAANETQLNQQLFYAHLYVGLFYEARGQAELARSHIMAAAEKHRIDHYMWDVASVHAARFATKKTQTPPSP